MRISSLHDDLLWPCVAHSCGLGELDRTGSRRLPLAEHSPLRRTAQFGVSDGGACWWKEAGAAAKGALFDGYHAALAPALSGHYETVVAAVFDRYLVDDLHRAANFGGDGGDREAEERTRAALEDLGRHGPLAAAAGTRVVLAVEGMDYVRSEAQAIALWDAGARVFAFQYNRPNALTHGHCAADAGYEGLTPLGRRVAADLLERGAVLDLAHAARSTRSDLLDLAEAAGRGAQVAYTHGALREDADAARVATLPGRFLDAAEARRVLRLGGMVGLTPARPFHPSPERFAARIASLVRNAEGGATGVALGTDFGGLAEGALLPGMASAPQVGERLADLLATRHGLGDDAIVAVLRANATAYLRHLA